MMQSVSNTSSWWLQTQDKKPGGVHTKYKISLLCKRCMLQPAGLPCVLCRAWSMQSPARHNTFAQGTEHRGLCQQESTPCTSPSLVCKVLSSPLFFLLLDFLLTVDISSCVACRKCCAAIVYTGDHCLAADMCYCKMWRYQQHQQLSLGSHRCRQYDAVQWQHI